MVGGGWWWINKGIPWGCVTPANRYLKVKFGEYIPALLRSSRLFSSAAVHRDLESKPSNSSFVCSPSRCLKHPGQGSWEHQITNTAQQTWVLEHDFLWSNSNPGTQMAPRCCLKTVPCVSTHVWQTRYFLRVECNKFQGIHTNVV